MRYYCKECNSELTSPSKHYEYIYCDTCGAGEWKPIPLWETPAQYKERTGKEWQGAVWYRFWINSCIGESGWGYWHVGTTQESIGALKMSKEGTVGKMISLCASQPCAPPDDFVMEVNND